MGAAHAAKPRPLHAAPSYPDATVYSPLVGDFDEDGHLDLLTDRLWLGQGSGAFTLAAGSITRTSYDQAIDLDGDGHLDRRRGLHSPTIARGRGTSHRG